MTQYRSAVNNFIKEFQYNYEEVRNRHIVTYFNVKHCESNDDMSYNLFLMGYNNRANRYIIQQAPCYFYTNLIGKLEPLYDYETIKDTYYDEFDECVDAFVKMINRQFNHSIHSMWEDGELNDDSYTLFYYNHPQCYYGKIDEPYLIFGAEGVDLLTKDYIYRKLLMSCVM